MSKKITVNIGTKESPRTVKVEIDPRTSSGQDFWTQVAVGSVIAPEAAFSWLTKHIHPSPPRQS